MRQPLKKQNPPHSGHRYSAYQNRIFLYLVTLVAAPLLLLGVIPADPGPETAVRQQK